MLDTARSFVTVDDIKKVITGMNTAKMNMLHIHFTDSESFPLQLTSFPEVTESGSYSCDHVYSVQDIKDLNEFAATNGVIIVPEIDSPGHSRSWANSDKFKEIDACHDYPPKDWGKYCLEPPCGQVDPTLDLTY